MNGLQRLAVFGLTVGGLVLGTQSADAQWRWRARWYGPVYTPSVEVRTAVPAPAVQVTTPAPVIQTDTRTRIDQPIQAAGTVQIPRATLLLNSRVSLSGASFPGRIVDFIIDDLGCIKHVILSHNNQFVMLPYQLVRFDAAQNMVHLNIQADRFRQAPTFTQWSMVSDPRFTERVNSFFGVSTQGEFRTGTDQRGPDGVQIQAPGTQPQRQPGQQPLKQPQQIQQQQQPGQQPLKQPQQFQQPQQQQPQQQQQPGQQQQPQQQQQQTTPPNDLNRPPDQQQINTPPIPPNGQGNERIPDE